MSNIRTRYYAKLGIRPDAPPPRPAPPSTPPPPPRRSPPCLRHKQSSSSSASGTTVSTAVRDYPARVTFDPLVRLCWIKHHDDFSDQEWNNIWVDGDKLDVEKDRNALEFQADGSDWRNATEEQDFKLGPDGSLVHPVTWLAYRIHGERNGGPEEPLQVDFKALVRQPPSKRWSPRPKQRKNAFWLFDFAAASVQKSKQANAVHHSARRRTSLGSEVALKCIPMKMCTAIGPP